MILSITGVPFSGSYSLLEHVPPKFVPIGAGNVRHAAVLLKEFIWHLKHGEHESAFGRPGDVASAGLAPDEFAGSDGQAFRRAFLVDQLAFEDVGLLDF